MKAFAIVFALLGPGFLAHAADSTAPVPNCEIEARVTVLKNGGGTYGDERAGLAHAKYVSTWQDCYKWAADTAELNEARVMVTVSKMVFGYIEMANFHTEGSVYIKWTFNDGYLVDTSGSLTKYTKSNPKENGPATGDRRVDFDNQAF